MTRQTISVTRPYLKEGASRSETCEFGRRNGTCRDEQPQALDPSPCVLASEIELGNPMAYLEPDGTIRFVDRIASADAAQLAARQERFVVNVMVHGRQLTALDWALRFVTPNELALSGDLRIRLDVLAANRIGYTVSQGSRSYIAIVERQHWRDFDVRAPCARALDGCQSWRPRWVRRLGWQWRTWRIGRIWRLGNDLFRRRRPLHFPERRLVRVERQQWAKRKYWDLGTGRPRWNRHRPRTPVATDSVLPLSYSTGFSIYSPGKPA